MTATIPKSEQTVPRDVDIHAPVLTQAVQQIATKQPRYDLYEDYYAGRHVLTFATDKFRNAFGPLFRAFAENVCGVVVDSVTDRLIVNSFGVTEGNKSAIQESAAIWESNRMDAVSTAVHEEAVRAGDAYVIVWPDRDGEPNIQYQDASVVTVRYDSETRRTIEWAAKAFIDNAGYVRLYLYYPDRIEKYRSGQRQQQTGVEAVIPDDEKSYDELIVEGEPWPLPNPYGRVPVFPFHNGIRPGAFGRSELRDVIPLQNALNKQRSDMLVASEFIAFPQRYATGIAVKNDPNTGEPIIPFEPGADRLWIADGRDADFGQFPAGDMKGYLDSIRSLYESIAIVSGTPLHHLIAVEGGWPSGEALKTAESRYVAKIKRKQSVFGNAWEDVMTFCRESIMNQSTATLTTEWASAEPRSDSDMLSNLETKSRLSVPVEQLWHEAGYSEEEIAVMLEQCAASSVRSGTPLGQTATLLVAGDDAEVDAAAADEGEE